jgi:hypothetical protein
MSMSPLACIHVRSAGAIAVNDRCASVNAVLGSGSDSQAPLASVDAAATASNGLLLIPNPVQTVSSVVLQLERGSSWQVTQ